MQSPANRPLTDAFRAWQEQSRLLERLQIGFIVGPPKTGTSWVTSTLHAHPNAIARGEGHLPTRLIPALQQALGAYADAQRGVKRDNDKPPAPWLTPDDTDTLLLARQACDRVLMRYIATCPPEGKERIVALLDKTPDNARHIPLLATLYPWARFICVTRDVRDAAVSSWFHRSLLGDTGPFTDINEFAPRFAHDVWAPMMWLARHAGAALGPARYTELRYEDYKADPAGAVERLCKFMGLPAEPAHVEACIAEADFKRQSGREPGREEPSFFRKGIVGDWQNHLSETAAAETVRVAADILSREFTPGSARNALHPPHSPQEAHASAA
jgi:hypothetical protein